MDKVEDLLLLDVIEVDDDESYQDLIGVEDDVETEDVTESEVMEEDSEVTAESEEERVGESLDVYVDDTQDDLDADIKDSNKSVSSSTDGVQSSKGQGKTRPRARNTSRERGTEEKKRTATRLKSSIVSVQKPSSSHDKRVGSGSHHEQRVSLSEKKSTVQKSEHKSSSNSSVQKSTAQKSSTSSTNVQKLRSSSTGQSGNKTEQKIDSTITKTRSGGQKASGDGDPKSSGSSVQKSSGSIRQRASSGENQKSSGGSGQKSSGATRQKPSSDGSDRKRSIGTISGTEEEADTKVSTKSSASKNITEEVTVPSCNLWVSGIDSSTRANDLKALFNKHVKVVAAKIMTNAKSPADSSCFGYIILSSIEDARRCISSLNNTELNGNLISVTFDKPKPEQSKSKLEQPKSKQEQPKSKQGQPKSAALTREAAEGKSKETGEKLTSKSTSKIIKLNKTVAKAQSSAKVTDVKNQKQRVERNIIKIKKSSGDTKARTTPKAERKKQLEEKKISTEKKPGMEKKKESKGSKIISLKSKSTDKSGEKSSRASKDHSVSKEDKGDNPRKMIQLNKSAGNAEGRGWQSGSGGVRNHRIGYFKSRNAMSQSSEQRHRKSPFRTSNVFDKSRRLKDLHIKQRAEAYKLQQEREEIRRATKEMEWRKQQEQIRLEQMDLERREREWEEQRLLEQIRIEEEERRRFEEEQRIVEFEEEQRRLAEEEMRLREEERLRFIEPIFNEADRFVESRWSPHDGERFRVAGDSPDDKSRGQREEGRGFQSRQDDRKHRDRRSAERYEAKKKEEREREKQRKEREHQERERREREKKEKERLERERQEREQRERERQEQERRERERLEQERRERERLEREMKEQERRDREKLEKERQERLRLEKEKEAQEKEKQELAERVKQLERENEEIRLKENKIKEELRLEKEEHDRMRREALKRSYEPRGRRDFPAQAKRQNLSGSRYSSHSSDRDYDHYQPSDHQRRDFNRGEDQREVFLEHREVAYSKEQNDYDERERYNKFAGERTVTVYRKLDSDEFDHNRNSETTAQGGYDRGKTEYGRDYDRYYDNHDRSRDIRDSHSTKTNSSYDRPRTDNKGDNRGSSYDKGHTSNSSHGYGKNVDSSASHSYSKNHDSSRGQDRNKGHTKKDFGNYKSSNKRDTYKTREDSDKSKSTNNRKDVPKGRSTDDLWRNAGYGKAMTSDRDHAGSSGDRGSTGGNYPGSNTQSTWSQRGRNSSSHVREGGDYQQSPTALAMKPDTKVPTAWNSGPNYAAQSASAPQTRMTASFGSSDRLNHGSVQDVPVQQTVMFQDSRLSNPPASMPYPVMSLPHRNSAPNIIPHPNTTIIPQPQPSMSMVPHPQEQGVQPGFVNVTYKYYTPGRPY